MQLHACPAVRWGLQLECHWARIIGQRVSVPDAGIHEGGQIGILGPKISFLCNDVLSSIWGGVTGCLIIQRLSSLGHNCT